MIDSGAVSAHLTRQFSFDWAVDKHRAEKGTLLTISPADTVHTQSFRIEVLLGWRSISAVFIPGTYASELLKAMATATDDQVAAFQYYCDSSVSEGAAVSLELNGQAVDPMANSQWPEQWNSFRLSLEKRPILIEDSSESHRMASILPWLVRFSGMSLALVPLKPIRQDACEGEAEGAAYHTRVKKYERSRINRAICLEIHGASCAVCGLKFEDRYGEIGEGFIHVHHRRPLSLMNGEYALDPRNDLIPVCPNCHAMLHRRTPPIEPEVLRDIMNQKSSQSS